MARRTKAKTKKICCSNCKSQNIELDTSEQPDMIFTGNLADNFYLYISARCLDCKWSGAVTYVPIKAEMDNQP